VRIIEIEVGAAVAGSGTNTAVEYQVQDGHYVKILGLVGSFQTDATVQSRVVMMVVTHKAFARTFPCTPTVPASANVNTLWSDSGQSVSAASLSSPGHTHGATAKELFDQKVSIQVALNNYTAGDVIGVHRVRIAEGLLEEFEI